MSEKLSAMILTGGSSSRFGSNKSLAMLEGKTLLTHLLTDLAENIEVVIVGPTFESQSRSLKFVQEDPAGGGPVAAVDAGLAMIDTEFVALIATDMPFAAAVIHELANSLESSIDGLVPHDGEGIPQTLCAIYRTNALKNALVKLGSPQGCSMRSLTALLELKEIELTTALKSRLLDIDTPEELQQAITAKEAENN
ncbi:MAG: molybdenum cofactor guanylyltransferase [Candidatus Nanopelagicaceae bacterium]|nr:molybdenum cofactor guanylyltransferase [Candidatus Nanopelagicaceae bacterium]